MSTNRPSAYDIRQQKGVRQLTQVHVMSAEEAAATAEAGIDIIGTDVGGTHAAIAAAAPDSFMQVGIPYGSITDGAEAIRAAFDAMEVGASAIYCSASPAIIETMAAEGIPVVGHIGLVPDRATWTNFRAIGKTIDEARQLYRDLKTLENAGAFAAELEVIPEPIATALSKRTTLITMSMGSGAGCDTQYLFSDDILGENTGHVPRHAKVYRDLAAERRRLHTERVAAFREYAADVASGAFPEPRHLIELDDDVRDAFDEFLAEPS